MAPTHYTYSNKVGEGMGPDSSGTRVLTCGKFRYYLLFVIMNRMVTLLTIYNAAIDRPIAKQRILTG